MHTVATAVSLAARAVWWRERSWLVMLLVALYRTRVPAVADRGRDPVIPAQDPVVAHLCSHRLSLRAGVPAIP
jgi:hypothetical protein